MLNVVPLSQRDPRWMNRKLGFSNYTIGTHGCTLTSLTMLLNHLTGKSMTPDEVNDRLKAVKGFVGALIYWKMVPVAFPEVKFIWRNYNYSNTQVAWFVYGKRTPVLVEVNAAKIGAAKHWVLYVGDRKCVDPWTGLIIPTATYPATGYALFERN